MPLQHELPAMPTSQPIAFHVYHDESGTYPSGERWLLHGVLLVPQNRQSEVCSRLQQVRLDVGYAGELHYASLRSHPTGPKARCAMGWLNLYAKTFAEFCFYHCLAIDTHSPGFQSDRFGAPYHAYNRFARMAIEGVIAWGLKDYRYVALRFYSDAKFRNEGDNFAVYIPTQICRSIAEKRNKRPDAYPEIGLLCPEVIAVCSTPNNEADTALSEECELIQLVDLITSSISQTLTARSDQEAKIALAEIVAQWIEDTRKPPWLQTEELYRRFSVSCFPDKRGNFYSPYPRGVNRNQPALPSEW